MYFFSKFVHINVLNHNHSTIGICIYPKVKNNIIEIMETSSKKYGKGLRKKEKKIDSSSINAKLKNYIIFKPDTYTPYMTVLADNNNFLNKIRKREKINFGFVPLTNKDILDFFVVVKENEELFSMKPKKDKINLLISMFKTQLEFFSNKDVDIIIFPEMYLVESLIKDIGKIIKEVFYRDNSTKIIIAGTLWSNNTNICYVYDNLGSLIYTQNKFTPFDYNNLIEYLNPSDSIINFLDVSGIGRIFSLICKDIMNTKLENLILETQGNILCYSAYSPSLDVISFAKSYSDKQNCFVLFSNACAPRINEEYIGFISIPQKEQTLTSCHTQEYPCQNNKNCNDCKPFIISVLYSEFDEKEISEYNKLRCKLEISY